MDGFECIVEGTRFSECTREQLEWAKQFDPNGTKFFETIWANPKRYSLALSDPVWQNNRWEDVVW